MQHLLILFLIGGFVAGCHPLPQGNIAKAQSSRGAATVYLIRGWRDLYSEGMDQLGDELREAGIPAEVYRATQWHDLAKVLIARHPSDPSAARLVLVGFSYGADDAIEIAQELNRSGIAVELVITIDPVTPPPVPPNVKLCLNYFQTNGIWDFFPWLRGIPLRSAGAKKLINVDIRKDRPDLLEPNTAHSNIAANEKLHREIVRNVVENATMGRHH